MSNLPSYQYLFAIPEGLKVMWSARAIYTTRPNPRLDILPDRQQMQGDNSSEAAEALCNWLNTVGIKGLEKVCNDEWVKQDESRVVSFKSGGFAIYGNPNSSYGYLYIVAYKE